MAPDLPDRNTHDPDAVAGQSFTTVRKGYEPDEVRAFLLSVASSMREAKLRYEDMERRLAEVERRAADPKDLDEHAVTQLLGEETARVLETARQAAADIRSRAETAAAEKEAAIAEHDRTTREAADQYASGVRSAADEADRRIRADAERYAEEIRSAADAETTAQRAAADEYDQRVRTAADTEIEELRSAAVAEAERLRHEAASVLTERTAEAEVAASAILGEADGYSTRVRADADRYSEATRAAADSYRNDTHGAADAYKADAVAEADRLRQEAVDEARRIREEAESEAAARGAEAEAEAQAAVDAAREQGRQMVEEARTYRERVIADLADRRRTARAQLDGLAATRDALAVALSDVAANLTTSHRMLGDLEIDPSSLGDVAGDRAVLEAGDASRPALQPEPAGSEPEPETEPAADDAAATEAPAVAGPEVDDEPVEELEATDLEAAAEVVDHDEPVESVVGQPEPEPDELRGGGVADDEVADAEAAVDEPTQRIDAVTDSAPDGPGAAAEATDGPDGATDGPGAPATEDPTEDGPDPEAGEPAEAVVDLTGDEPVGGPGETTPDDAAGAAGHDAGDHDPREGRIDQIFARIRADRQEPGTGANSVAAVASVPTDVLVDESEPEGEVVDSDPDTDLLDRRDAALEEIEKQLARRLKRVLADEQNETLDLLRRTKGTPTADAVLPPEADHQERYRSAALTDLDAAERTGAGFFGPAPDRRADVYDVAGDFAGEILRQIRSQLVRAFEDGGDEYELGDRIRSCYREWKTQRIADTAGHFVMVAFNRGVAEATPDGGSARWLVDDGDQPCPDCDDNALGGAVPKGEPFPTGHHCPPAHPGCRCLAVPVS